MGDRRQVVISRGNEKVYLYTHWDGYELPEIVRAALGRGANRWDDAPYLTRIIFCEMVKDDVMSETGAGIWSSSMDSEYDDIFINLDEQTVKIGDVTKSISDYANGAA